MEENPFMPKPIKIYTPKVYDSFAKKRHRRRKKPVKKKTIERHTYRVDRKKLLLKQKDMCAYKLCPKLHEGRRRQKVNVNSHLDHIIFQ